MDWNPENAVAAVTGRWCGIARFGFRSAILVLVFGALAALNLSDALADEFEVAIVISPTADGAEASDFLNGFQLAVDQSPDVSHPPNTEGGDHLGSMDVAFVVIDDLSDPVESATVVAGLVGVPIVVVDVSPEVLDTVLEPLEDADAFVIATRETTDPGVAVQSPFIVATQHRDTDVLLTDRVPTFSDAYTAAYGVLPSEAATRGYIAGRMVDASVEATDRDPTDRVTLAIGIDDLLEASQTTVTTAASASPELDETPANTEAVPVDQNSSALSVWVVVAVLAAGIVILVAVVSRSRNSSPGRRC